MPAARFTLITPECIRIEYSPSGRFVDAPTLLAAYRDPASGCRPVAGAPVVVEDRAGQSPFTISTQRFELAYTPDGAGLSERSVRVRVQGPFAPGGPDGPVTQWMPGAAQRGNLGGTIATLDGIRGPVPLPDGLLARDGWYLIDDSQGHLLVDGWIRTRDAEPGATDWYLLAYGRDYHAALRAYTALSGPVPLPRRYLLGSWYSRYWPHTSEEFRQIVRDYESHEIPLDVVVLDMDWHRDGWTGWSWNRELLPDAEDLLRWLHGRGLAVTLNVHPADGVGPHEDRYGDYMRALERDPASDQTVPFDAGDRRQMGVLLRQVIQPLESPDDPGEGVDFWWLDWQQDKFVRSIPDLTNLQWLNRLFFEHTRVQVSSGGASRLRRGVSFSRWAGDPREHRWGDHRYPIHFSGDAHTGWRMLAFQVPFTSTAGNVGCFFWSHDIGGHYGPRIEEATARWVQFGALSAALRLHSARSGVLDRRPWTYQEPFFQSMRSAFQLRASLMPYIYSQVHRSCDESTPLLRPMYIDHPGEARAYHQPQQYMFGSDLLAAPIVRRGVGERCVGAQGVWFPALGAGSAGRGWREWRTGQRFPAGDEAIVSAAIDEIPLYVPEGAPVPLEPPGRRSTADASGQIHIRLWPSPVDGQWATSLVEDDGITEDLRREHVARTPIAAAWSAGPDSASGSRRVRLAIGPTVGAFAGQPTRRVFRVEIGGVREILHAEIDGQRVAGELDTHRSGGLLALDLPERSVRDPVVATIDLVPGDAERLTVGVASRRFCEAFGRTLASSADPDAADALRRAVIAECEAASGHHAADALAIGAGIGLVPCGEVFRLCDTFGWIDGAGARIEVVDQVGPRAATRSDRKLRLEGDGRSRGVDVELPEDVLAEPPLGLRASRWIRAEIAVDGRPLSFSGRASTRLRPIPASAWRVIGPFPWDWAKSVHDQVFTPEENGGRGLRWRDWHDARNGSWVTWTAAKGGGKWPVDMRLSLNNHSGLGYALTRITSSRRQSARLVVDSSDKTEIWFNAEKVYSQDGFETRAALEGGVTVNLPQGRSTLLVKCARGGGGWGFSLEIDGACEVDADCDPDDGMVAASPRFG